MTILFALYIWPSVSFSESQKGAFRCKNPDGSVELNDKGCRWGAFDKIYSPQEIKDFASNPNPRRYVKKRTAKNRVIKRTVTKRQANRYPHDYAASHVLKKVCGKKFDGVNATNLNGLKRSLKIRKSKNMILPVPHNEINELNCRIRRLSQVQ